MGWGLCRLLKLVPIKIHQAKALLHLWSLLLGHWRLDIRFICKWVLKLLRLSAIDLIIEAHALGERKQNVPGYRVQGDFHSFQRGDSTVNTLHCYILHVKKVCEWRVNGLCKCRGWTEFTENTLIQEDVTRDWQDKHKQRTHRHEMRNGTTVTSQPTISSVKRHKSARPKINSGLKNCQKVLAAPPKTCSLLLTVPRQTSFGKREARNTNLCIGFWRRALWSWVLNGQVIFIIFKASQKFQ